MDRMSAEDDGGGMETTAFFLGFFLVAAGSGQKVDLMKDRPNPRFFLSLRLHTILYYEIEDGYPFQTEPHKKKLKVIFMPTQKQHKTSTLHSIIHPALSLLR